MSAAPLSRRAAVRSLAAAAASTLPLAIPACRRGEDKRAKGPVFPVALLRCPDYGPAALAKALAEGWAAAPPPAVGGKRVVIKPNLADFHPDRPIHTDARLVEALIMLLRDAGAGEVVVAEGPPHNRRGTRTWPAGSTSPSSTSTTTTSGRSGTPIPGPRPCAISTCPRPSSRPTSSSPCPSSRPIGSPASP